MEEIKRYKTSDLVLKVDKNYDPTQLPLQDWDRYIDILVNDRQYQKEAIIDAVVFLASGLYKNTSELVENNWNESSNIELKNRYSDLDDYLHHLQIPTKLSASIDLATGTGKSYVIYGIAQIMLGLGLADRVLVLCPSLTIEDGLTEKFIDLSSDSKLLKAIPENAKWKNPSIKSADVTIKEGDICIENIHAAYETTGSSIKDSFKGNGETTLVLNDEAHHIYNKVEGRSKENTSLKKWKEFLLNPEFNFKYIVGFTGTAYIEDEYFNDVIYRYSLRQAVDNQMVKMVDYISKDENLDKDIKFQKIYDNHDHNKQNYRKIKPLTILITKDIKNAKRLLADISEFLIKQESLSEDEAKEKTLIVTSHNDHKANIQKLKEVDNKDNPIEWIVSVSMLTEGWDVKNVFQIVPWEDRAFNSKLLIAQVLGRGLRIPLEYQNPQPKVRIFNHDAWSRNIKGLVDEILEIEKRLISVPLVKGDRNKHHFKVHHIDYSKKATTKEATKDHTEFDYTKGFIELQSQVEESEKESEYTDFSGAINSKKTLIHYNTYTIDEVANKIVDELKVRNWEGKILKLPTGDYSKQKLPPKNEITKIIRTSMDKVGIKGNRLVEKNRNKILNSFNTLLRKAGKTVVYQKEAQKPYTIDTKEMNRESMALGNLRHNATVFYSSDFKTEINEKNLELLNIVIEDEGLPRSASKEINKYLFKTPLDLTFSKATPERTFIKELCETENAKKIESWLKSRDMNFYSIEYSITSIGGKHSKIQSFNPDFFLKLENGKTKHFVIVEIKSDGDVTDENKAKLKYGVQHFKDLNKELEKLKIDEKYHFHFLSPNSYDVFFDHLRNGILKEFDFRSDLEDKLLAKTDE
ncbi:MAG: DEAD/DEAH box helicase family protein [Bacteroidetes bacterium]|nr:DEAD/DEAH box helicase family protein [Bacteroidota bacterium]